MAERGQQCSLTFTLSLYARARKYKVLDELQLLGKYSFNPSLHYTVYTEHRLIPHGYLAVIKPARSVTEMLKTNILPISTGEV